MARGLRGLLEKVALRHSVGVYVGDHEVTVSRVALSVAGPVELSCRTEPCEPERLHELLEGILKPITAGRRAFKPTVSVGLPTLRVFFASKPVQLADPEVSPNVLLHEVLRSSNVNVDEMEVDLVKARPGGKPLAVLIAGRRKYLAGLLSAVSRCGVRPHRTEPAPFALVRLAAARSRGPRRCKTVVRVFLGTAQGVAVLVSGETPLSWRVFELPAGGEAAAVGSTAKAIQLVARFRAGGVSSDAILIHGRPDLAGSLATPGFLESLGARGHYFPAPGYDPASIALGLALGCRQGEEAFDLSRAMKPRASFWNVFPFGEVGMQVALLGCLTLFLHSRYEAGQHAFHKVRSEAARHKWMGRVSDEKLEKEKNDLKVKVDAIREYLETSVRWSAYTRDVSARIPETLVMASFDGNFELDMGAKVKSRKGLSFRLSTPIPRGQGLPREIDNLLNDLRRDPLLKRDFPDVKLGGLTWVQPTGGQKPATAEFTVNCRPLEKSKAKVDTPKR